MNSRRLMGFTQGQGLGVRIAGQPVHRSSGPIHIIPRHPERVWFALKSGHSAMPAFMLVDGPLLAGGDGVVPSPVDGVADEHVLSLALRLAARCARMRSRFPA